MFRRTIVAAFVAVALAGPAVWPAQADQGRGKHKGHIVKMKSPGKSPKVKAKGKHKAHPARPHARTWTWTDEQRARLTPMLPPGLTLEQAAAGFRNQGQFIATLNASREHNMSFHELKHLIVDRGLSLGQAMQTIRRR